MGKSDQHVERPALGLKEPGLGFYIKPWAGSPDKMMRSIFTLRALVMITIMVQQVSGPYYSLILR